MLSGASGLRELHKQQRLWIEGIRGLTGKSYSRIATDAGLANSTLTRFVRGHPDQVLEHATVAAIARSEGVPLPGTAVDLGPPEEASEGYELGLEVVIERFAAPYGPALAGILAASERLAAFVITTLSLEGVGYLPGDVVLVDRDKHALADQVVAVQVTTGITPRIVFRVITPPYLWPATRFVRQYRPMQVSDSARVIGPIVASLRLPAP